jgi:hypothetical protein
MQRIGTTLLVLAGALTQSPAQSWGSWQIEAALPTGGVSKSHAVVLEHDGRLYALGGAPWSNGIEDGSVYSMPVGGGLWVEELPFDGYGHILSQGGGVDDLNRIVIFGGDDDLEPGNADKPPFQWEPSEGPWLDLADRGSAAPLAHFAYCADESHRLYSFGGGPTTGGSAGAPNSAYAERYIGSLDTWEAIAPMPIALANAAASVDGLGHILVFGGILSDGAARSDAVLRYDIPTNTWSTTANSPLPVALSNHRASLGADGRVYVMGGVSGPMNAGTTERRTHVYDPMTDSWTVGPDMAEPRRNFGAFLASDDRIYVVGGENPSGGSFGVESLYGTPCPSFNSHPTDQTLWRGATLTIPLSVSGGGTVTYQWTHDGQPLVDGPSIGGGTISGSDTPTLRLEHLGAADAGAYAAIATNTCGSVESSAGVLTVRVPPEIPQHWTFVSLHPAYADSSSGLGLEGGVQVGRAIFDTPEYNNIDHPTRWEGTAASAENLTPSGAQGGSIVDFAGDKLVGWQWEPISCYVNHQWQTCYYRRACWWELNGTFHSTSYSGFEYTTMTATDGVTAVGSGTTDDASGNVYTRAVIWQAPTHEHALSLHPTGYRNSSALAVDGEFQFGTASLPYAVVHAAMWRGSSASFVDMNPPGAGNSSINDASDGQAVGVINQWNNPHAGIWYGTPESFVDITPAGATSSGVSACAGGLQIGYASFPDGSAPGIWAGSADTFTPLTGILPPGYAGLSIADLDIAPDGTISLIGSASNTDLGRLEAVLITSSVLAPCPADLDGNGTLDLADINIFVSAFVAGGSAADLNNDSVLDLEDIGTFVGVFVAGCP